MRSTPDEIVQKTTLCGQTLVMHPLAGLYWQEAHTLLIADVHLGKVTHFRKNGAAVPDSAAVANLDRLIALLLSFSPERVIFLGDLFHSVHNREWEAFAGLIGRFPDIQFELIQGNHDILPREMFLQAKIHLHTHPLCAGPFIFSHEPLSDWSEGHYNLGGHIHPAARLHGPGRQYLRLPCFYFGARQGLLPAFGVFTGLGDIRAKTGDQVFVIAGEKVIPMQ